MIGQFAEQGRDLIWSTANRLMWWRRLHTPGVQAPIRILGDRVRYQWPIIANSLNAASIIYSFGIGTNATFELDVIEGLGCQVFAFDPTPRSDDWAREQKFPPQFRFLEVGIADIDGEMEFYPPPSPADVSYSAHMEPHTGSVPVRAPVRTLGSLMSMLGHEAIDMLKMDIEGCEYAVVDQLATSRIRPGQLLIEFHHGFYGFTPDQTRSSVRTLRSVGYEMFWISDRGLEYGFVHKDAACIGEHV
jgi:FkbM family methyltransferase